MTYLINIIYCICGNGELELLDFDREFYYFRCTMCGRELRVRR